MSTSSCIPKEAAHCLQLHDSHEYSRQHALIGVECTDLRVFVAADSEREVVEERVEPLAHVVVYEVLKRRARLPPARRRVLEARRVQHEHRVRARRRRVRGAQRHVVRRGRRVHLHRLRRREGVRVYGRLPRVERVLPLRCGLRAGGGTLERAVHEADDDRHRLCVQAHDKALQQLQRALVLQLRQSIEHTDMCYPAQSN